MLQQVNLELRLFIQVNTGEQCPRVAQKSEHMILKKKCFTLKKVLGIVERQTMLLAARLSHVPIYICPRRYLAHEKLAGGQHSY